ncbi:sphingomyelin phosphodiesterase [Rhipicephalus sanguineus]|uniref:sphingomyelin phosphodiesterase n=1 Tax=Rhipicephalus sanguineus TaxID=34632 RepID=UPI0020C4D1F3|nr:sphingomyelin phosphodiesterase [Rhipicephalus sanguineus]
MKSSLLMVLVLGACYFLPSCHSAPTFLRWVALRKFLGGEFLKLGRLAQRLDQDAASLTTSNGIPYCGICKLSTTAVRGYLHEGLPESVITALLREGCGTLGIETPRVCAGLVQLFKDEFFYVLGHTTMTPAEICGIVFPDECPPSGVLNWTVPLPARPKPPVTPVPLPKVGSPTLRVLHISDTHVDPSYSEGSEANCNEPLCCHAADVPAAKQQRRIAGHWGAFHTCDIPPRTFEHMLKTVRDTQKIDYVIWTGDMVAHDIWNTSRLCNLGIMEYTVKAIEKYLPGVPVYPALGNHEGQPVDSFPIPAVKGNRSVDWLYTALASQWSQWLPPSATLTMKRGAFYAVTPFPGLKIISLNMNYCNTLNWWLLLDPRDPAEQLAFLVNELQESEMKGQKVHIIGHIPPGQEDCLTVWSDNYNRIIERFESTVRGQFFGHTHTDELEVFYESVGEQHSAKRPYAVAYVAPSATTFNSGNPAFRVYVVDGNYNNSTWAVLDHETYVMNLTEANADPTREPRWHLEYAAKAEYAMHSLEASQWDNLLDRMEVDDELFQKFYKFYSKEDPTAKPCTATCRKNFICKQRTSKSADFNACQ